MDQTEGDRVAAARAVSEGRARSDAAATEDAPKRGEISDPDPGGQPLVDVDGLAEEFLAGMETALGRFAGIDRRDTSLAALMALTRIIQEFLPPDTPVIAENVVTDIDTIVRQVRFTGWSQTESGDRTIGFEIREVLKKYGLPTTGPLFDRVHSCIRANY